MTHGQKSDTFIQDRHMKTIFLWSSLFLLAVRLTLGCSREVILVHLVLNNAFYISISDLAIIENLVTRLGFLDWSGIKWGLNYKPSESYLEI